MAIVDYAYYTETFHGTEAAEEDFAALEAAAADIIGAMTRWRVTEATIADLPAVWQELVKKAVCAQVESLAIMGVDAMAGDDGRGFTVGKVSISGRSGSDLVRRGAMQDVIAPRAIMYLEQTGLLNPQTSTLFEPMIGGDWL